jgi:hypothetical protein
MCAGGGAATIGYERIHWRTKRTGEVRNRIRDISTRSARAMLGSAVAASLVFVAGGSSSVGDAGALNTAEVYDPTQGTFTPVSNTMASSRFLPAAALLPDGDVLVVGGQDQNGDALSTADLYDPATNSFPSGARAPTDMTTGRSLPVAATLDNGDVLVAGGADSSNAPLGTAEVYDPSSNSWTPTANTLSTPRLGGGIAPLPDGRELLVGGESAGLPVQATTATTDFYSPSTNSFTPGPAMATPRFLFGIDAPHDGRVLVAGGAATSNGSTTILSGVEIFDPATDQWSATAPLPQPLAELATDVLPEGQVLAAGGTTTVSLTDASTQALLYTPASVPTAPLAVTLRPSRSLVGDPSRVKVQLVIVGYDAAGSRSTTTRTITVRR